MDYKAFYADVLLWIEQVNRMAMQYGMDHQDFWPWVIESSGRLCQKYHDHRLAIKQMIVLVEWLEEVHESRKGA